MDDLGLKLFKDNPDDVKMPTINKDISEEQSSLISDSIQDAITGSTVKKLILPESSVIAEKNFIFDFSKTASVTVFQREALKSLVSSTGDVALYLYKTSGLVQFGKGEKYSLERMIPLVRHFIFADEIDIYKDYQPGCAANKVVNRDITKMRLNL